MAYFKNVPSNDDGKISYNGGIVSGIVVLAISEMEGVRIAGATVNNNAPNKSIKINFEKNGIHVFVDVLIDYTLLVSEMAFKIQENIKHNVEAMTEYHIAKVNVNVVGVLYNDEVTAVQNN